MYTQTQSTPNGTNTVTLTNTPITNGKKSDDVSAASLDAARNMLKQLSLQDDISNQNVIARNINNTATSITTTTTTTTNNNNNNNDNNTNGATTAVVITSNLSSHTTNNKPAGTFNKEQYYKVKLAPIDRPKTVFTTNTKSSLDRGDKDPLLRKLKITQNLYQGAPQNKLALQSSTFNPNLPTRSTVSITDSSYIGNFYTNYYTNYFYYYYNNFLFSIKI